MADYDDRHKKGCFHGQVLLAVVRCTASMLNDVENHINIAYFYSIF
jgi:hypothetical protein